MPHLKYTSSVKAILLGGSIEKLRWCRDSRILFSVCVVHRWHFTANPAATLESFPLIMAIFLPGMQIHQVHMHADLSNAESWSISLCYSKPPFNTQMTCSHRPEFLIHTDQVLKWLTPASARFRKVLHSLPVMTLKTILFLIYQKSKTLCWRLGRPVITGSQVTDGLLPSPSPKKAVLICWNILSILVPSCNTKKLFQHQSPFYFNKIIFFFNF